MSTFSRRYLLTCTAASLASQGLVGHAVAQGFAPTAQLFASLIVKWRSMLLGTTGATLSSRLSSVRSNNDRLAQQWLGSMRPINSANDDLWNDAASSGQPIFRTRISLERLRIIAISWATPGAKYYNNNAVIQKLRGAISHISQNKYKSGMSRFIPGTNTLQNWWEFEIGIPLAVLDIIVILGEKIEPRTRYNLNNAIKFFRSIPKYWTATNRTWFCHVVLLNAVTAYHVANAMGLSGQLAYWQGKFWEAKSAILGTFNFVTGEGFHKDGSFVMHGKYAYTGGYGVSMLQTVAGIIHLLDGTQAEFSTSEVVPVIQWVYRSFEPLMFRGLMMDMSRGRGIARYFTNDHDIGHQVIDAVALLSLSVPSPNSNTFKGMVKYWINKDSVKGYFSSPKNMYVAQRSESFLNSPSIPERGETVKNYQFRGMDRVVHKQTSFTFAVSCYSNRIANYESINQENLKGWYTGSGMTYLYLDSDLDHYSDAFWPTVNSYKMPGTTIDRRSRPDTIEGRLGQATVGGVSAGGSGVSCMQLNMDGSQLTAKKSWFMFGGYLTCLGTDIHSSSPYAVDTIIENRNLGASGANKVTVGYRSGNIVDMPGAIGTIGSAKWINIAGVAGYVILNTKAFIEGVRERREGSWRDINSTTRTITTKYQRNYLRFSFRHGANVNGGAYAYTILPKASVSFTRNYANKPIARVLNNNKSVQCVTCTFSNAVTLTGAVFWSAGTSHDGQKAVASSSAPLCLLVRKAANVVEITYSDPTSTATSDIEIKVFTKNARSVISKPDEDIVSTTNNSITIRFRPAKLNGASRTVQVRA